MRSEFFEFIGGNLVRILESVESLQNDQLEKSAMNPPTIQVIKFSRFMGTPLVYRLSFKSLNNVKNMSLSPGFAMASFETFAAQMACDLRWRSTKLPLLFDNLKDWKLPWIFLKATFEVTKSVGRWRWIFESLPLILQKTDGLFWSERHFLFNKLVPDCGVGQPQSISDLVDGMSLLVKSPQIGVFLGN